MGLFVSLSTTSSNIGNFTYWNAISAAGRLLEKCVFTARDNVSVATKIV